VQLQSDISASADLARPRDTREPTVRLAKSTVPSVRQRELAAIPVDEVGFLPDQEFDRVCDIRRLPEETDRDARQGGALVRRVGGPVVSLMIQAESFVNAGCAPDRSHLYQRPSAHFP
jgi:hypothetical protein